MPVMTTTTLAGSPHVALGIPRESVSQPRSGKLFPTSDRLMSVGNFSITVDELLVARARRGEARAIEELHFIFESPVYTLARRLSRSSHDAEDVLQETFMEVLRSLPAFRGEGSFAGWVRRITASKALQRLRRARPTEALDEGMVDDVRDDPGSHTADAVAARVDLETALQNLSDTARSVLWLHDVEGYSHEEIGALWGKTGSFSKSQLARAHARLRAALGPPGREAACTLA
jgi:RNA polymerase sigma-70 factor (ECF subfamily)